MVFALCKWLENSAMASALRNEGYWYQIAEVSHYFSMFGLIGSIAAIDLRVLGLGKKRQSIPAVADQLFPWTWISLGIVVVTGVFLFMPMATDFYFNPALRIKLLLITLGLIVHYVLQRRLDNLDKSLSAPAMTKALAFVSLLVWIGTILGGTEIAFHPRVS